MVINIQNPKQIFIKKTQEYRKHTTYHNEGEFTPGMQDWLNVKNQLV